MKIMWNSFNNNNNNKNQQIFVYNPVIKTEDTFHWHIYICSRLCKWHYYSFILWHRFKNVCQLGLICNIIHLYSPARPLENALIFRLLGLAIGKRVYLLPAWPIPARWKTYFFLASPARPVGKITSHLRARPGPLEKSLLICRPVRKIASHLPDQARYGPRASPGLM